MRSRWEASATEDDSNAACDDGRMATGADVTRERILDGLRAAAAPHDWVRAELATLDVDALDLR